MPGPGAADLGPAAGAVAAPGARRDDARPGDGSELRHAARQFEAVLLRQLVSAMRRSAPKGGLGSGGGASGQYLAMFDQVLADHMAETGGIGLADVISRGLGGEGDGGGVTHTVHALRAGHVPLGPAPGYAGDPAGGAVDRLRHAASELLDDGGARRFARDGQLRPDDLASELSTPTPGGDARFNVADALGYRGYYKCNLFALEMARRAGYEVPVVGRARGWGYPGPTSITEDAAADRRMEGEWSRVVTGVSGESLDGALRAGQRAFMLVGASTGERQGHMAVLERVHRLDYAADGRVQRVEFDGWEARGDGARHLVRRTWNLEGVGGGPDPRGGFGRIEVLELQRADRGARAEVVVGGGNPGASVRDGTR